MLDNATLEKTKPTAPKRGADLKHRDASWFAQKVEQGKRGIFAEIVTITPDIANRLLEQNEENRKPKERTIAGVARDIKCGHWEVNGETIKISIEGWLNDGQNRLLGIIRADEPVQTMVAFGLKRKSRMTVDMGMSRTASEFLFMQKVPNANAAAIIARMNLTLKSGHSKLGGAFGHTKQDVIAYFDLRRNDILTAHKEVGQSSFARSVSGHAFLPTAYMNIRPIDTQGCENFFSALATGANLDVDDPVLWLRARLIESRNSKESIRNEARLELVLRYWNTWARGDKLKKHVSLSGSYPKIIPSTRED